jgi:hypothetical protein
MLYVLQVDIVALTLACPRNCATKAVRWELEELGQSPSTRCLLICSTLLSRVRASSPRCRFIGNVAVGKEKRQCNPLTGADHPKGSEPGSPTRGSAPQLGTTALSSWGLLSR